jgi:Rod binding domain-containing protein
MKISSVATEGVVSLPRSVEDLRGRSDPAAVKAAARELESVFAYEMIKAMRATTGLSKESGLGADTYRSMFDMELARVVSERGLGLQEMMLKGLENRASSANGAAQGQIADGPKDAAAEKALPVRGGGLSPALTIGKKG